MQRTLLVAAFLLLLPGCGAPGAVAPAETTAASYPSGHWGSAGAGSPARWPAIVIARVAGLLTADGRTVYTFDEDLPSTSTCIGACEAEWEPLRGKPVAGAGVPARDLALITRPDASMQITFYRKPLYRFRGDRTAGDTRGDGRNGLWHAVRR